MHRLHFHRCRPHRHLFHSVWIRPRAFKRVQTDVAYIFRCLSEGCIPPSYTHHTTTTFTFRTVIFVSTIKYLDLITVLYQFISGTLSLIMFLADYRYHIPSASMSNL